MMRGLNGRNGSILIQKKFNLSLLLLLLCCFHFIDYGQAGPFHRNRRPQGRRPPPAPLPAISMTIPSIVWKTADPIQSSNSGQNDHRPIPLNWGDDPSDPMTPQFNSQQNQLSPRPQTETQNGDPNWTGANDQNSMSWTEQSPPTTEQRMDIDINNWSSDRDDPVKPIDVDLGGLLGPFIPAANPSMPQSQTTTTGRKNWSDQLANQNQGLMTTTSLDSSDWSRNPPANQETVPMPMDHNINTWIDQPANQPESQMITNNWSDQLANQNQGHMNIDTNSWNVPPSNQQTMDIPTNFWNNQPLPAKNLPLVHHQTPAPQPEWRRQDQVRRGPIRQPIRRMKNKLKNKKKGRRPPSSPPPRGTPHLSSSVGYHDNSYMPQPDDNSYMPQPVDNSWMTYSTIPIGRPTLQKPPTPSSASASVAVAAATHKIESNLMLPPPGGKMEVDTATWLKDTAAVSADSMTLTKSTTHNHHHHHYHYVMPKAGSSTSANKKGDGKKVLEIIEPRPIPQENGGGVDSEGEGGTHFFDIEDIFENAPHLPGPTPPPVYSPSSGGEEEEGSHFEMPILPPAAIVPTSTPPPVLYNKNANLMDNILFRDDIEAKLNRMANWQIDEKMKHMAMAMAVEMEEQQQEQDSLADMVQSEALEIDEDVELETTTTTEEPPPPEPLIKFNLGKAVNNFSKACAYWMPDIMNFGQSFCNSQKQQDKDKVITTPPTKL